MLDHLLRELRHSRRGLARSASFTVGFILTLALTIGVSTSVFSVVSAVLVRPLPYGHADRLTWVSAIVSPGRTDAPFSLPEFLDYRAQTRGFSKLVAYGSYSAILTGNGPADRLQGLRLSADAFDALGMAATVGRLLVADDDRLEAPRVAVVGHGTWERRFGSDHESSAGPFDSTTSRTKSSGCCPATFRFPRATSKSSCRSPQCAIRGERFAHRPTSFA